MSSAPPPLRRPGRPTNHETSHAGLLAVLLLTVVTGGEGTARAQDRDAGTGEPLGQNASPAGPGRTGPTALALNGVLVQPALVEAERACQPVIEAGALPAGAEGTDEPKGRQDLQFPPAGSTSGGWTFGGYGDFVATTKFFGPDPNKDYDPGTYRQTDVDLSRIVFLASYDFTPWLSFRTEVEFEHGGTGAAMEVEWDEFGEIEQEIEKGGEIVIEQALLEARFGKDYGLPVDVIGVRLGHLLVPVGMISYYHFPTMFGATRRAESEEALIPSTWHETGAELFLRHRGFSLQLQGITGLDSTGFSSARWIAGGTQRAFEVVRANDWAFAARAEYSGFRGLLVGGSFYTTNTTGNRPKRDIEDADARATLGDLHLRYQNGAFRLSGEGLIGSLTNADLITRRNASLSAALGAPKTPVASAAYSCFLETSLNVLALVAPAHRHRVDVFLRYEGYDTMWKPPEEGSGFDNPLYQRQVVTTGLNYFPHPRVVLKGEYVSRWINKDDNWARQQHEVNVGLGFAL